LCAAESETFTGTAAASGTYKRPQLLVDGKRYELKASNKADASVAEVLAWHAQRARNALGRDVLQCASAMVNPAR
jgi:hypothetical protein